MTRLNVAFVVPAGLLGCLTMSAALVVGHAEISQLRPHERRMAPVTVTAESPFRVIAGVYVPDPAPPRESVPSPSAAAAPAAAPLTPAGDPVDDLLRPDIPSDVPQPGAIRKRLDKTMAATPDPARGVLAPVVDTVYSAAIGLVRSLGVGDAIAPAQEAVSPPYTEAMQATQPEREAASAEVAETWETVRH